jgi:hypothetical protein
MFSAMDSEKELLRLFFFVRSRKRACFEALLGRWFSSQGFAVMGCTISYI